MGASAAAVIATRTNAIKELATYSGGRRETGERPGVIDKGAFAPVWVLDSPIFAWNEDNEHWDAEHHPFCVPRHGD